MIPTKLIVMSGLSIFALGYCTSTCFHRASPAAAPREPPTIIIEPEHDLSLEEKIADSSQEPVQEPTIQPPPYRPLPPEPTPPPETKEQRTLRALLALRQSYLPALSQASSSRLFPQDASLFADAKRVAHEYSHSISNEFHFCYTELKAFLRDKLGGGK